MNVALIPVLDTQVCPKDTAINGVDMRLEDMRAYIGDDGRVHIVADHMTMRNQLAALDLTRAKSLTKAAYVWVRRVKELTSPVTSLLHVRNVWCDTKNDINSQKFVLWAGFLLERR